MPSARVRVILFVSERAVIAHSTFADRPTFHLFSRGQNYAIASIVFRVDDVLHPCWGCTLPR